MQIPQTYVENTDPLARQQRNASRAPTQIPGWGTDLDPKDRPAHPKERTPPRLEPVAWSELPSQVPHMKIHHSTERSGITPVFGTGSPPRGLSGKLRDVAFGFSENDLRHWLILLLADRVNVGEGIAEDLARGRVPNVLAEMGIAAEWRYNRAGLVRKVLVASAVVGVGVWLARRRRY